MPRKRKMKSRLRNLIVVSDLHCGCRLGLCPPDLIPLDDGGNYQASEIQLKVWSLWQHFWNEWVPSVTHGEPFGVVCNGDIIDGSHHSSTTQISQNLEDQEEIAIRVMEPIVKLCRGRFWMVRGTEAHVGKSATSEERIAKRLKALPNSQGQRSRWELNLHVGDGLCNFMHHISTTSSSAHETSALNAEYARAITEAGRWGHELPDVVVRSHRHQNCEIRVPTRKGYGIAFVTAAWQLPTPFKYKVAARMVASQFGGSLIRQGDEELHTRHMVWALDKEVAD